MKATTPKVGFSTWCITYVTKLTILATGILFLFCIYVTEAESIAKKPRINGDASVSEEASSSGLNNVPAMVTDGETAEAAISQSDSENKDPSSNTQPEEEFFQRRRGRPSKHFLRKKYKKYMNRK